MKLKRPHTKPIPVRLDDELIMRLQRAARRMGSNNSAVIRFSILNQLTKIERGQITLPAEGAQ